MLHKYLMTKKVKDKNVHVPYMNVELRRDINVKNMFKRKYDRCKTRENRVLYQKHRNITVELRKKGP